MDDDGTVPDHTVAVVAPDPRWADRFAQAAAVLRRVLPEALLVEHIGSTAVPGLVSKDTIDVLVVIDDLAIVRQRAPALAVAGYDLRLGSPSTTTEHLFLRRVVDHRRTHHVHALVPSSPEVGDFLVLRDYLRVHPGVAAEYGATKIRLAAEHGGDRTAYVHAKPPYVEALLTAARTWAVTADR
jgi:GrpB-like predicted nucleotidyltransferase (UPF0157 family)